MTLWYRLPNATTLVPFLNFIYEHPHHGLGPLLLALAMTVMGMAPGSRNATWLKDYITLGHFNDF